MVTKFELLAPNPPLPPALPQAEDRFSQLLEQARACNQPNKTVGEGEGEVGSGNGGRGKRRRLGEVEAIQDSKRGINRGRERPRDMFPPSSHTYTHLLSITVCMVWSSCAAHVCYLALLRQIMYDQEGDLVVAEERDYVGALTRVVRLVGGEEVATDDPEELKHIQIITEVG